MYRLNLNCIRAVAVGGGEFTASLSEFSGGQESSLCYLFCSIESWDRQPARDGEERARTAGGKAAAGETERERAHTKEMAAKVQRTLNDW